MLANRVLVRPRLREKNLAAGLGGLQPPTTVPHASLTKTLKFQHCRCYVDSMETRADGLGVSCDYLISVYVEELLRRHFSS